MGTAIRSGPGTTRQGEPCAGPMLHSLESTMHGARHAVAAARHATEDLAADAVSRIRRHPLRVAGAVLVASALAGSLVGFGAGWFARMRTHPSR